MNEHTTKPRRSLILAGGGIKVAFQAGVLQVWLDEAGLEFEHADGASGGALNLAMWAQGMTGHQIADNWRRYRPLSAVEPNVRGILRLAKGTSFFKMERFRHNVLNDWGLDWPTIRATSRQATFNLYDFSRMEVAVTDASEMDEDRLLSAISLPMWFPPVSVDGHTYIDAVYATDANLEEAIRRGADELWVIWTVSRRDVWKPGFVAQYFHIVEVAANSQLKSILRRIERNNSAVADHRASEFGRHIEVKCLQAEVPLHYLFNFRGDRVLMAVELGVAAARRWCAANGYPLKPPSPLPAPPDRPVEGIRFREQMVGFAALGFADPSDGSRAGAQVGHRLRFTLTIEVDDLERFVAEPEHDAAAHGWLEYSALGGRFPVRQGRFNLFVDEDDPAHKRMLYQLHFTDLAGFPLTLLGQKVVRDNPGPDVWSDTTTLYVRILKNHIGWEGWTEADIVAAGVLRITPRAFLRQLTTFRTRGETLGRRANALARFGRLFAGQLWDVYVTPGTRSAGA